MSKKSAVIELEPEAATPNGTYPGYRPKTRTRRITADRDHWPEVFEAIAPMWPDDGQEPFWADVRANLTFDDIDAIPTSAQFAELWDLFSPWVVAWNATAWDQLEMGTDAFRTQPREVTLFILNCLKYNIGTDLPKGLKPTADTDGG
jgi:hypothetical protein